MVSEFFERAARLLGDFLGLDIERRPAVRRQQGEGQRDRRMRDVGAANVEGPGDGMRIGKEQRIRAMKRLPDARELGVDRGAGVSRRIGRNLSERRRRTIGPDRVDRIMLQRDQRDVRAAQRLRETLDLRGRMDPGIVADARARLGVLGEPTRRGRFADVHGREQLGVDLAAHLQDVAPVDEDRRLVLQNHGEARRAGKAGQPGEPLGAFGDIFVLVLVGARREKTVEILPREPRAQRLEAGAAGPAFGGVGEGLEFCFEHDARLVPPRAGSKSRYALRGEKRATKRKRRL